VLEGVDDGGVVEGVTVDVVEVVPVVVAGAGFTTIVTQTD